MPELEAGVSLVSVWLLGASLGLTACTITCLPFMSSWVIARAGIQRSIMWLDASLFVAGRILAYTLLALTAAVAGQWLETSLGSGVGNLLIALAAFSAAIWLLLPSRGGRCGIANASVGTPPFWLGFSLSFVPCAPLATLLALAAQAGVWWQGAGYGLAFGLGAALTPVLLILPLLHAFSQKLRAQQNWLPIAMRWLAAFVLVLLGLRRLSLWYAT
ncbi:MAG: sulfite exporter TauE/SafE family protein [Thiotrichales bacterium]|jgi:sulfite exporter TauE/SafE|nr:sulfite exporter TauE/SafE family protein [Thiotrichales bacterium]